MSPSAYQNLTRATLGLCKPLTRRPHKRSPPSPSTLHAPSLTAIVHCLFPGFSSLLSVPCHRRHHFCPCPARSATKYSQWRNTASTTTLKMVGNSGSPCVTPLSPKKGSTYHPPVRATILSRYQYLRRRRRALVPTPYSSRMSRHLDLSKASYALCISSKVACST